MASCGKPEDLGFSYRITRQRTVFVHWRNRRVLTVSGRAAEQLLQHLEGLGPAAVQIVLAKATGNFKRGNEHGR